MPEAWYMDDSDEDPREKHHLNPHEYLSMDLVNSLSGVEYFSVNVDKLQDEEAFWILRKERGYDYEDVCEISESTMPNYHEKLKIFYTEHLHDNEEIRLMLDGSGYFDVRDKNDKWIRIKISKGDLLILPGGIYHRFTVDNQNYAKAMRLFCGAPVWTPINRPADDHPSRKRYLASLLP